MFSLRSTAIKTMQEFQLREVITAVKNRKRNINANIT